MIYIHAPMIRRETWYDNNEKQSFAVKTP